MITIDKDEASALETVKDLHMAYKSHAVRAYAVETVRIAIDQGHVWPDEVRLDLMAAEDRSCVGTVYRWLMNVGVIHHSDRFRRSTAEGARSRTIFRYDLASLRLARAFLRRHGVVAPSKQSDLFQV